jgi:dTDP-4-dehydrorhamnose reductase
MRILVLGAGGQVGRAVTQAAPTGHTVLTRTRAELDIADEAALTQYLSDSPVDWIVNGAAYTAVDRAESERASAQAINDTAVGVLARAAAATGARLFHLSTDFVFDGRSNRAYLPHDPTHPLSVYGASKLGGEERVREAPGCRGIVLRTAWVYDATGRNFVLTMLRLMRERPEVRVVADQIGAPTAASGIARVIWDLIGLDAPAGIYHWTDAGVASWYDFAVAIQEEALARGLLSRPVPVLPIPTSAYPTPAERPKFSVLDSQATRTLLQVPAQHWRHNLRNMLDELRTP